MSQLLQVFRNVLTSVADGTVAPTAYLGGIPTELNSVAIDTIGAIATYHQGLPYTAEGRLASSIDVAATSFGGGAAPFTAAGRLAFDKVGSLGSYLAGVPFEAGGAIWIGALPSSSGVTVVRRVGTFLIPAQLEVISNAGTARTLTIVLGISNGGMEEFEFEVFIPSESSKESIAQLIVAAIDPSIIFHAEATGNFIEITPEAPTHVISVESIGVSI